MREDVIKHRQKAHQVLHLVAILNQNSNDSRPITTFADSAAYDGGAELEERADSLCANAPFDRTICMPGICLSQ